MPITILPYQPTWPTEFQTLAVPLRAALGPLALRIDHIGSTSVPDLPAKDVIDIQVTASALDPAIDHALSQLGYQRRPHITRDHLPPGLIDNPADWTKWFFNGPADHRPINLHVRPVGRPNQRYPLLFRDYLRAHPQAAQTYAQIKQALARLHPDDPEAYYDIKDPVCDLIMLAANQRANETRWTA